MNAPITRDRELYIQNRFDASLDLWTLHTEKKISQFGQYLGMANVQPSVWALERGPETRSKDECTYNSC